MPAKQALPLRQLDPGERILPQNRSSTEGKKVMRRAADGNSIRRPNALDVKIAPLGLPGCLRLPSNPFGIVVLAHGSGSSRLSPRNVYVAESLGRVGLGPLLFDLLSSD
ncbi:hypothetical protein M2281_002458 [Mesorhizobium soli]|uniref:hypothetical protein n=1 Tax=Pseudaminobacter soli (ex Li et al. 2025) TaxID=1295366 RepID=UPI0024742B16|nr:hypothetical protein [Mesorhizobium soli]MDH6231860.1 hypothetical protein [Mesorhizobium soli]